MRPGSRFTLQVCRGGWGPAPTYHDEPIQVNVTTVQALHITELRTAINQLRNHSVRQLSMAELGDHE